MHNTIYNLCDCLVGAGMDVTPGGTDESLVPAAQRLGQAVNVAKRVELLVETTCFTVFSYVAQVRHLMTIIIAMKSIS